MPNADSSAAVRWLFDAAKVPASPATKALAEAVGDREEALRVLIRRKIAVSTYLDPDLVGPEFYILCQLAYQTDFQAEQLRRNKRYSEVTGITEETIAADRETGRRLSPLPRRWCGHAHEEHGLGVLLHKGMVVRSGQADQAF